MTISATQLVVNSHFPVGENESVFPFSAQINELLDSKTQNKTSGGVFFWHSQWQEFSTFF